MLRTRMILLGALGLLAAATLMTPPASAQAQRGAPSLKPGYEFDPATIPALNSLVVLQPESPSVDEGLVTRRFHLSDPVTLQSICVEVAVSAEPDPLAAQLLDRYGQDSEKRIEDRFNNGADTLPPVQIGDECMVDRGAAGSMIQSEVVFRRANIRVAVCRTSDVPINLYFIAQAIDGQIQAISPVPSLPVPTIDVMGDFPPQFHAGDEATITVDASAPGFMPEDLIVEITSSQGDVRPAGPAGEFIYRAGGLAGDQPLRVIVITPALVAGEWSGSIAVAP